MRAFKTTDRAGGVRISRDETRTPSLVIDQWGRYWVYGFGGYHETTPTRCRFVPGTESHPISFSKPEGRG